MPGQTFSMRPNDEVLGALQFARGLPAMSGAHRHVTALQAQNGSTPLHNAASNGHHEAAEALALHCDCDIQNSNGNTALHVAASKGGLHGGVVSRRPQASHWLPTTLPGWLHAITHVCA